MTKSDDTAQFEGRPDVDFSGGVRGKYAERYENGATLVSLAPDVAARLNFSDSTRRFESGIRDERFAITDDLSI